MNKTRFFPQKIFVTKDCQSLPLTQKILRRTGHIPFEFIEDSKELIEEFRLVRNPVGEGKKFLLITRQSGAYIKPCPCTPDYIGCNYFIINTELNCPLDCSYCILQLYLTNPLITVHADAASLYKQLDDFLQKNRNRILRIGTGELGDSLALDHLTVRSTELISYFKTRPHAYFELKTKTVNIDNLLSQSPPANVVVSWSLNSEKIAAQEEFGAPPVHERIHAARIISQAGYRVGFHFDPLVLYKGWEAGYREVIQSLLAQIDREKIAWISLGSLRFPTALKSLIRKRFPKTKMIYGEFITGRDGKLRYAKPLRRRLFQKIYDELIRSGAGDIPVYLCMESKDIWSHVLKKAPRSKIEVEKLLTLPLGANEIDF